MQSVSTENLTHIYKTKLKIKYGHIFFQEYAYILQGFPLEIENKEEKNKRHEPSHCAFKVYLLMNTCPVSAIPHPALTCTIQT